MFYGVQHGIGAITLHTGIHGNRITGITITGIITTGITTITVITVAGTIHAIHAGTTSITVANDHIPDM